MKVPFLDLAAELDTDAVLAAVREQLEACSFVGGPAVAEFEARYARLCGTRFAVGLNSGTDAIFLALKALGIGPGDEVITAPNSFIASAGAVVAAGATPVFSDVGPDYQLDPELLDGAITPRTKALLPVHLTGTLGDMDALLEVAGRHGLALIEDAAQSIQATYRGRPAGSFGVAGCFSLHPLKNLNVAGDGGMLSTDSEELRDALLRLRNHGLVTRDEAPTFGYNSRLDSIQAAIGSVVLERIDEITARRRELAARYDAGLASLAPQVLLPPRPPKVEGVYQTYVVQCERRDALRAALREAGVGTKVHYPRPIHLMTCGRQLGYGPGDFPVCEAQAERIVSLPVHHHLSDAQVDHVIEQIAAFYGA